MSFHESKRKNSVENYWEGFAILFNIFLQSSTEKLQDCTTEHWTTDNVKIIELFKKLTNSAIDDAITFLQTNETDEGGAIGIDCPANTDDGQKQKKEEATEFFSETASTTGTQKQENEESTKYFSETASTTGTPAKDEDYFEKGGKKNSEIIDDIDRILKSMNFKNPSNPLRKANTNHSYFRKDGYIKNLIKRHDTQKKCNLSRFVKRQKNNEKKVDSSRTVPIFLEKIRLSHL